MKIAINTRFLQSNKLEGIGIYTQEIFKRVVKQLPQHEFYFLFDRAFDTEFIFEKNVTPVVISPPARHPFLWYYWFEFAVPRFLKENNIDLFISPDGFCSLSTTIPQILTIHDLGFEHYPKHVPFLVRHFYKIFTSKYCQKAYKILAVSQFTKQDLQTKYRVDENKITVVYNGFYLEENTNNKEESSDIILDSKLPYFIFIGAIHPRKNVLTLLKSFEFFKMHFKQKHQLLIIGRKAWMNAEVEEQLQKMQFKNDVIWIKKCSRNNLIELLKNAVALVYPSLFEGFGIPIVEAMSLGVPVIVSNTSAMPEIVEDAGILVDPTNINEIAQAMQNLVENPILRKNLITKGRERSTTFSWDISANNVVEIIKYFEIKRIQN